MTSADAVDLSYSMNKLVGMINFQRFTPMTRIQAPEALAAEIRFLAFAKSAYLKGYGHRIKAPLTLPELVEHIKAVPVLLVRKWVRKIGRAHV